MVTLIVLVMLGLLVAVVTVGLMRRKPIPDVTIAPRAGFVWTGTTTSTTMPMVVRATQEEIRNIVPVTKEPTMTRARAHKLLVYPGKDGKFYWRAVARNGREVGASEQGYARRAYARHKAIAAYPDVPTIDE